VTVFKVGAIFDEVQSDVKRPIFEMFPETPAAQGNPTRSGGR
jgi:hypothetical protein